MLLDDSMGELLSVCDVLLDDFTGEVLCMWDVLLDDLQVKYWACVMCCLMILQVKYWVEKGKQGHLVYKYLLRRRPDQGDLATSRVEFGGKSAPKGLSALTRPGVYDVDLSCGKEAKPVCRFFLYIFSVLSRAIVPLLHVILGA